MFGCPAEQIRSFSETFTLIPDDEEDDEICATSDRVLTTEELIERFNNRENIFSINENIKLKSSEIITILFAILACSTYGKEDIKQTRWSPGLFELSQINISDVDTMFFPVSKCLDDRILSLISQLTTSKNDCLQNVDIIAVSIADIRENGSNIHPDSWIGYNTKSSYLSKLSAPRGPPLQKSAVNETVKVSIYMSSLKCKNAIKSITLYFVFTKDNVDARLTTLIGNNECNYTSGLLHYCKNISSLLLQADRRYPV